MQLKHCLFHFKIIDIVISLNFVVSHKHPSCCRPRFQAVFALSPNDTAMPSIFPPKYTQFLHALGDAETHAVADFGVYLYGRTHLAERNQTYQIEHDAPDYFMIGQDGDVAFFLYANGDDEAIFTNGLGALGSQMMTVVAPDIDAFVRQIEQGGYEY